MKILKYELSEWKSHMSNTCLLPNWYRTGDNLGSPIHIGFIRKHSDYSGTRQIWMFDYVFTPRSLRDIIDLMPITKEYYGEELDQARQDVDNLILKINNLKCFL